MGTHTHHCLPELNQRQPLTVPGTASAAGTGGEQCLFVRHIHAHALLATCHWLGLHHSTACKAEELTATIQPGLHHTAMKWLFWPVNSYFLVFFIFSPHTSHHVLRHALAVGNQPGECKKGQEESEKEKKDVCVCVTIIGRNRTRNLSIGNRCIYHCTIIM